jgi:chromosome segregation ATPase
MAGCDARIKKPGGFWETIMKTIIKKLLLLTMVGIMGFACNLFAVEGLNYKQRSVLHEKFSKVAHDKKIFHHLGINSIKKAESIPKIKDAGKWDQTVSEIETESKKLQDLDKQNENVVSEFSESVDETTKIFNQMDKLRKKFEEKAKLNTKYKKRAEEIEKITAEIKTLKEKLDPAEDIQEKIRNLMLKIWSLEAKKSKSLEEKIKKLKSEMTDLKKQLKPFEPSRKKLLSLLQQKFGLEGEQRNFVLKNPEFKQLINPLDKQMKELFKNQNELVKKMSKINFDENAKKYRKLVGELKKMFYETYKDEIEEAVKKRKWPIVTPL